MQIAVNRDEAELKSYKAAVKQVEDYFLKEGTPSLHPKMIVEVLLENTENEAHFTQLVSSLYQLKNRAEVLINKHEETIDEERKHFRKQRIKDWNEEIQNYKKYFNRVFRWFLSTMAIILLYSFLVRCSPPEEDGFLKIPGKDTIEKFAPPKE